MRMHHHMDCVHTRAAALLRRHPSFSWCVLQLSQLVTNQNEARSHTAELWLEAEDRKQGKSLRMMCGG